MKVCSLRISQVYHRNAWASLLKQSCVRTTKNGNHNKSWVCNGSIFLMFLINFTIPWVSKNNCASTVSKQKLERRRVRTSLSWNLCALRTNITKHNLHSLFSRRFHCLSRSSKILFFWRMLVDWRYFLKWPAFVCCHLRIFRKYCIGLQTQWFFESWTTVVDPGRFLGWIVLTEEWVLFRRLLLADIVYGFYIFLKNTELICIICIYALKNAV